MWNQWDMDYSAPWADIKMLKSLLLYQKGGSKTEKWVSF